MTSSKQRNFTYSCFLKDIKGSQCCVIKVRQYIKFIVIDRESQTVVPMCLQYNAQDTGFCSFEFVVESYEQLSRGYKVFSCLTQLSIKCILFIKNC